MSTLMLWELLMLALAGFLAFDLTMARKFYRMKRSRGHEWLPFLRWWAAENVVKLSLTGAVALVVTLALTLHEYGLVIPEFWSRLRLPRKAQWAMGAGGALAAFVLLDLFMAWRYYHGKSGGASAGVRFYRWWLGRSAKKFAVVGTLAGLVLGGAYAAHRYNLLQLKGETSGYMASAQRYYEAKKYREATLELRNALKKNPSDEAANLWLARCYWRLGDGAGARDAYREALRIEPKLYAARLELARLSFALKDATAVRTEAEQALALAPKAAEPRLLLARLYLATGKQDLALAQCRAAMGAELTTPELRQELVTLLLQLRAPGEALQGAEAELKQNPRDLPLSLAKAQALHRLGRGAEAEAVLRNLAAASRSPEPCLALGEMLLQRGEYVGALKEYEEALNRAPDNELAMNNFASLNAEHGFDMERSAPLAARLYARHQGDPAVADTLGWTLFRQGKTGEALPLLRQAVAGMPGNPVHRYHLGAALFQKGNLDAGKRELTMALKISGSFDGSARARELLQRHG